jgi:hypothetical protein
MINISIKDYIGIVYNGLLLLLILNINDKIYELNYWFDIDFFDLKCDSNFLIDMNINNIEEYENYEKFIEFINININKEKLINDILLNQDNKKYYELIYIDNILNNINLVINNL